jgi:hypothetical protein
MWMVERDADGLASVVIDPIRSARNGSVRPALEHRANVIAPGPGATVVGFLQ